MLRIVNLGESQSPVHNYLSPSVQHVLVTEAGAVISVEMPML